MRPRGKELGAAGLAAAAALAVASCDGRNPLGREQVVVEERRALADGESLLLPLESGRYRAELSAEGEGVTVEWRGAECPGSGETRSFSGNCELPAQGQILVQNPPGSGSGVPATVHVRVVKLPL